MSTMLYKHPGPHKFKEGMFDYIVTDDVDAAKKDGWHMSLEDALNPPKPKREKKAE